MTVEIVKEIVNGIALVLVSEVYGSGSFTDSMGNNYHIGEGFFV